MKGSVLATLAALALVGSAAAALECPPPGPLDHTVHHPHPNDCTKFYVCDNGNLVLRTCPSGLHFNPTESVCDWPNAAGCTATPETTTQAPPPPPPPPGTCPTDEDENSIATLLPHESDCTKFYKCANGVPVEFTCPSGLHFNNELKVCDWPDQAGCQNGGGNPNTTPSPTTTTSSPTTESGSGSSPAPDGRCPTDEDENSIATLLPHETDCTKFYKCANGVPVEFTCPSGLHFNNELKVCDWPDQAGCQNGGGNPNTTTSPTTTTSSPTTESGSGSSPAPDGRCPTDEDENSIATLLPHETDCTKFYKCANGVPVEFTCPAGLHFNNDLKVCDWPWDAGCDASQTTTPAPATTTKAPTTTTEEPEIPTEEPEIPTEEPEIPTEEPEIPTEEPEIPTEEPEIPTEEPEITTEEPEITTEPQEITTRPPTDGRCPTDEDENSMATLLPHETDCTLFYICAQGKPVLQSCPHPLHFNNELKVCDWPEYAGCAEITTPEEPDITTEEPEITTEEPEITTEEPEITTEEPEITTEEPEITTEEPEITTEEPEITTEEPEITTEPQETTTRPPTDGRCPTDEDENSMATLFPHETDCTLFYICAQGKPVLQSCPHPLHFNNVLKVCDWPQNAGCAPITEPEIPTTPAPGTCPIDENENSTATLLPHETDCTKFYICANGVPVEFDCPPPLHFNNELKVCDWPQNAGCVPWTTPSTPPSPTTEDPEIDPCANCFPSEYHKCQGDNLLTLYCPRGQVYNKRAEACENILF